MTDQKPLAVISRNVTEQIHIRISEFKGKKFLDIRIFYTTDEGKTWLPTKKGVAVYPENISDLQEAIELARKELESGE